MAMEYKKYHMLLENLPDAFAYHQVVLDNEGKPLDYIFLDINTAFEKMTGLKRAEVLGKKVTEVLPGIEKSGFDWIGTYGKLAFTGETTRFESYSEPLDRWYEVTAYSDEPGFFAVVFRDISKVKRDKYILETSKTQLQAILNFLPDATFVIDLEGKILVWNKAMEEMTGTKSEDMLGKDDYEYTIPFYGDRRPCLIDMVFRPYPEIGEKYSWITRKEDGSLVGEAYSPVIGESGIYIWAKAAPIYDARGKFIGAIESVRDITERKRAEEALRKSEEKYREILAAMEEGYYEVDLEGNFVFFNDSLCRQLGYNREELMKENYNKLSVDTEKVFQTFNRVYHTGKPEKAVGWSVVTREGEELFIEVSVSLRRDSEGNLIGFRGVTREMALTGRISWMHQSTTTT